MSIVNSPKSACVFFFSPESHNAKASSLLLQLGKREMHAVKGWIERHSHNEDPPKTLDEFRVWICSSLAHMEVSSLRGHADKVVIIFPEDSLVASFHRLIEHNILSAPVCTSKSGQPVKYAGFLDTHALVSAVIQVKDSFDFWFIKILVSS
jgi:hypothetical protein